MTTGHVFIATSLDGCVARADHRLDWLTKQPTDGDDLGYDAFMDSVDGIVMGRGSYETVLSFGEWPYAKPVVVMSRTLSQADIPAELQGKVRLVDLDPPQLMASLHEDGWSRAHVDGGKVVQSFVRCGLIEDFVLTTIPVLIGEGIRLFGEIDMDVDLDLISVESFPSGLVQSRYRVRPRGEGDEQEPWRRTASARVISPCVAPSFATAAAERISSPRYAHRLGNVAPALRRAVPACAGCARPLYGVVNDLSMS